MRSVLIKESVLISAVSLQREGGIPLYANARTIIIHTHKHTQKINFLKFQKRLDNVDIHMDTLTILYSIHQNIAINRE